MAFAVSFPPPLDENPDLTRRLREWLQGGDADRAGGGDEIFESLGGELARIASRIVGRYEPGETLRSTALLSEFWLKLSQSECAAFRDRKHFMGLAVTTMRCIVIDHLKAKRANKRDSGGDRLELEEVVSHLEGRGGVDLIELHDAMNELARHDPDSAHVIDLRFFGGMSVVEVASHLGWPESRVRSEEVLAKKRLARLMK